MVSNMTKDQRDYKKLVKTAFDDFLLSEKRGFILVGKSGVGKSNFILALTDDFGESRYDLILMSSLTHHFSSEQNIAVSKKAAKALTTGGYFVIQDWLRPEPSSRMEEAAIVIVRDSGRCHFRPWPMILS